MTYTIKDVAKRANVSIATVSRILNNQTGYSEKTKVKVLQAIEDLGYQPNAVARGLIKKRTQTIGIMFPSLSSLFTGKLLTGVEKIAHSKESSVIACHTVMQGKSRTLNYLQMLNEKRIDGLIFTSELLKEEYYEYIEKMNIPVVLLATESYAFPLPYVKVNDFHASYSAVQYLIKKGHKKIGMISGDPLDPIAGKTRIQGYKQALEDYNLPFVENAIFCGTGFLYEEGKANFHSLMKQDPDITALFCASDEIAIGSISAAYELGISVPEELSIIGFDNIQIAEMSVPPLTTVAQPLEEMGETATKLLFDMLENPEQVESKIMPHRIIERGTVRSI
ncbi:LacI family DNA-binding transcriptional regulator [Bacillus sp. PS06]|uniref:LacI family DNA-binding transcriptional regulator n=1 Tax=Bacillus sp. PS06 TaxID=2764176 RepID=UPI0017815292|nr:LacI family DNA-binding transcriptional regulator [Bacillus sp. PS06]MBD8067661.1 LacI family DNA-binding transcriptional regulator [Bacillus sp. PS06]